MLQVLKIAALRAIRVILCNFPIYSGARYYEPTEREAIDDARGLRSNSQNMAVCFPCFYAGIAETY